MDIFTVIICGLALFTAAIIQSAVGFGYALFATPILVWSGIPLHEVIVIIAMGTMIQSAAGVRSLRNHIPWKPALTATAFRVIWLIIGLLILKKLITLDLRYILFIVGSVICLLVVIQLIFKPKPIAKIHWIYTALVFSASGVFAGMLGMGGPPLVLWVMAHDWPPEKTRSFYFATFLTFIPILILLMSILPGFGPLSKPIITGLAFFPVIYAGSLIGLFIGNRISKQRLYYLTCLFLIAMGISVMISAF